MQVVRNILGYNLCLCELVIFFILSKRYGKAKTLSVLKAGSMILVLGSMLYISNILGIPFIIKLGNECIILYGLGKLLLEKLNKKVYLCIVTYVMALHTIKAILAGVIAGKLVYGNEIAYNSTVKLQAIILALYILLLCMEMMLYVSSKQHKQLSAKINTLLIIRGLLSIIGISVLIVIQKEVMSHPRKGEDLLVILTMLILICNLIVYCFIMQLKVQLQKEENYQIVACQNETLVKVISANKEVDEQRRKMGHDFNNHISCIDMLLQMGNIDKARGYIAKMNANYSSQYSGLSVDNEIADAIINEKVLLAQKHEIAYEINGSLEELQVDPMDLCILLSNSLDNAIEAARQVDEVSRRYICLKIQDDEKHVVINICNSFKGMLQDGEKLLTTKQDKEHHGIGMMSMQAAAQRNGGIVKWTCKEKEFELEIKLKKTSL